MGAVGADGVDAGALVLRSGLGAEEVAERAARALRWGDVSRRALAFYLAEMQERGLCAALGYPSVSAFAAGRLGMARRSARELVRVGCALRELELVERAFGEGALSWSKVRVLCRVCVAETEGAWVGVAQCATQEELERLVQGRQPGDGPPGEGGVPEAKFRVRLELDAAGLELWRQACAKLRDERGCGGEVSDAELALEMVRMVLESEPDGSVPGRRAVAAQGYRVVVGGDGVAVDGGSEPVGEGRVEELTEGARVPGRLRARVFARDGHRCVHCGSRRRLQAHHVVWWSRGGRTELDNLVTVCAICHGLIHEGFLGVAHCAASGPGPGRFEFRDARGRPLSSLPVGG